MWRGTATEVYIMNVINSEDLISRQPTNKYSLWEARGEGVANLKLFQISSCLKDVASNTFRNNCKMTAATVVFNFS